MMALGLEQIEKSLPNGLHDAEIRKLTMDYENARLVLSVSVLTGIPSQPYPDREACRSAEISFLQVQFYSVEYPQAGSSFRHPGNVSFSYENTPPDQLPVGLLDVLPPETLCYSLFIRDWLSHIHIGAGEVAFSWLADG